ncbi:MAG: transposase [Candidatus Pacebacteria bacterium]|nr:transposase [Candidatus Paceibacterota bacterium]
MPYRKDQFTNNEIYHITLRGIDEKRIFRDIHDYYRMIFSVYEFNNVKPVSIQHRRKERERWKNSKSLSSGIEEDKRERIVDILAFVWMPNHIHLLLNQLQEGGITKFMRKVGTGFAAYFNKKYNKSGYVFQNRFFSLRIDHNEQLKNAFTYINVNPASLVEPKWKEFGIKDSDKVINFLENYKWSSYQDYLGRDNFPSVTHRGFITNIFGGINNIQRFVDNWILYKKECRAEFLNEFD